MDKKNLQDQFAPASECYGCGPANSRGLQIKSIPKNDKVIAEWKPKAYHQAFPNILNGGVIGTLLDCHCNWAAAWFLMQKTGADKPPCTVTADYSIKLLRPTPMDETLTLEAELENIAGNKVRISGKLLSHGKVCATCIGTFVAVSPGHPAYGRW